MAPGAIAAAASLKRKVDIRRKNEDYTFRTPARYGWGMIAPQINPRMAAVCMSIVMVKIV